MVVTTPSDPSATLEGMAERHEHMRTRYGHVGGLLALAGAKDDMPRAIAALKAALGFHVEAVIEDMPEPRFRYCKTCSGHPAWPCPEVTAITKALNGDTDG